MKNQVYFGVAIRIIILFSIGFAGSFIPDNAREFFGDTWVPYQENSGWDKEPAHWKWSAQHCWYFWACVVLFLWSLVNLIWQAMNLFRKYHPEIIK